MRNLLTNEGVKALAIVIASIIVLSVISFVVIKGGEVAKRRSVAPVPSPTVEALPTVEASPTATPAGATLTPAEASPSPTREATPSARRVEAAVSNFAFEPASITTGRGSTITWINQDAVAHTVTAVDGSFDSGSIAPGDSFTQRFDKMKSYSYTCSFHPQMKGTLNIR